jgi:hypothetical protein
VNHVAHSSEKMGCKLPCPVTSDNTLDPSSANVTCSLASVPQKSMIISQGPDVDNLFLQLSGRKKPKKKTLFHQGPDFKSPNI